jgi:hypothetical protein
MHAEMQLRSLGLTTVASQRMPPLQERIIHDKQAIDRFDDGVQPWTGVRPRRLG